MNHASKALDDFARILLMTAVIVTGAPPVWGAGSDSAIGIDFAVNREDIPDRGKHYSPFANSAYPNRVLWGESHLHTS